MRMGHRAVGIRAELPLRGIAVVAVAAVAAGEVPLRRAGALDDMEIHLIGIQNDRVRKTRSADGVCSNGKRAGRLRAGERKQIVVANLCRAGEIIVCVPVANTRLLPPPPLVAISPVLPLLKPAAVRAKLDIEPSLSVKPPLSVSVCMLAPAIVPPVPLAPGPFTVTGPAIVPVPDNVAMWAAT